MASWLEVIVRFLHILFGVAWVGGGLFYGHSVLGGLRKAPPEVRGPAMMSIGKKQMTFFLVAGPLTFLFGLWNQFLLFGGFNYSASPVNQALGVGFVLTLVMLAISFGVTYPTFRKLEALGPPRGPPSAELMGLQKRLMMAGMSTVALGVIVIAFMVVATAFNLQP